MTTHNERIAEIEVLFRAGNDRMAAWPENRERIEHGEALPFFCECGHLRCRQHLHVTGREYEAIRSDARWFLVAPGHEMPEAEDIIGQHDSYLVVQKHEDVRDLVERMNLRRSTDS